MLKHSGRIGEVIGNIGGLSGSAGRFSTFRDFCVNLMDFSRKVLFFILTFRDFHVKLMGFFRKVLFCEPALFWRDPPEALSR